MREKNQGKKTSTMRKVHVNEAIALVKNCGKFT
jgi:hypothetical protein